ncbi:hypothetical protein [Pseudofulvibacter geojedonensis]|uniref:Type II secretion system protein GspC N-terminal domain-containing protein n=1 Tax=Pseudofulvibacter geojedonensis TaxID=1123758 RepID=A0ABW3I1T8_9FLAO
MDKKKKTYLLLVVVLGLWGTIGYKIISALNPEESEVLVENISVDFSPEKTKIDTFSITQVKRDPFLGKLSQSINKTNQFGNKNSKNNESVTPWPQIQYQGIVKKQGGSSKIFIITINQQQYLLKKNQEVERVKLIKGTSKEVYLRFNKETKIISAQ